MNLLYVVNLDIINILAAKFRDRLCIKCKRKRQIQLGNVSKNKFVLKFNGLNKLHCAFDLLVSLMFYALSASEFRCD